MKQIFIKVLLKVLLNLGDYNPLVMIDNGMDVLYLPCERNIKKINVTHLNNIYDVLSIPSYLYVAV